MGVTPEAIILKIGSDIEGSARMWPAKCRHIVNDAIHGVTSIFQL